MIFQSVTQAAWKKKIWVLQIRVEPMTFWLPVQMLYHLSYRRLLGVKDTKVGSSDKHPTSLAAGKLSRVRWWWHRAGKGRRACNYVSGIWIPPPILLWLSVDWAVRFPPSGDKRECKQTLKNMWKHAPRVMTSYYSCHLRQSALSINFSHADIQIPET